MVQVSFFFLAKPKRPKKKKEQASMPLYLFPNARSTGPVGILCIEN